MDSEKSLNETKPKSQTENQNKPENEPQPLKTEESKSKILSQDSKEQEKPKSDNKIESNPDKPEPEKIKEDPKPQSRDLEPQPNKEKTQEPIIPPQATEIQDTNNIDAEIEQEFEEDPEEKSVTQEDSDPKPQPPIPPQNPSNQNSENHVKITEPVQKKKVRRLKKKKRSFCLNGLPNDKMDQYDGLKDDFLQGFFCNEQRKKHLVKMGLVTKDGYVVNKPEEYLRKKALYKKLYGLENKEGKGKRSKTFNKKTKNPYEDESDSKHVKPLKESKKVNVAENKRG